MTAAKVVREEPTGALTPAGEVIVRIEFRCGCYALRAALPSPLKFKGSRVPLEEHGPGCRGAEAPKEK